MATNLTDHGSNTVVVGPCGCGGYGSYNAETEAKIGRCHDELDSVGNTSEEVAD